LLTFDLWRYKIVQAGAGRSHTVVVTDDGNSLAFGWNKHGQLGSGSAKTGMFYKVYILMVTFVCSMWFIPIIDLV
jgi:alpha-tubulin suppressor-like RCC1 family protein